MTHIDFHSAILCVAEQMGISLDRRHIDEVNTLINNTESGTIYELVESAIRKIEAHK